jgi:hypothetical protein
MAPPSAHHGSPPITAAVCGLYCEACSIFLASRDDPARLAALAGRMGWTVEETYCEGCRADRRTVYCRTCAFVPCTAEKGVEFCGECARFPCAPLVAFRDALPHRIEIFANLTRLREVGVEAWMEEVAQRYECGSCGTINSAYDLACRHCGHSPGSPYAADHEEEIAARLRG